MAKYGMVIDLSKCMGCRACMEACKTENGTPASHFWMSVFRFEEGSYPDSKVRFLPRPCNHCENPPCVAACPYNARIKWRDGLVQTDYDNCRGTRKCEDACPYGVNYFNIKDGDPAKNQYLAWDDANLKDISANVVPPYWTPEQESTSTWDSDEKKKERRLAGGGHRGNVVGKCTFCVHRLDKGINKTACQQACPVGAIIFGDLDDSGSDVAKALAAKKAESFRLKESSGTLPKVYYLGAAPADSARLVEKVPVTVDVQKKGTTENDGAVIPWK